MKKIIVVSLFCMFHSVFATEMGTATTSKASDNKNFTLYLVRHAEKQTKEKDPVLTQCGELRAAQIAVMLSKTGIEKIYSTQYKRTQATAKPSTELFGLDTIIYDPSDLKSVANLLIQNRQSALVVGHSNTTPQLASLLANTRVDEMTEQEYQRLYQIQIIENKSILTELTQPWVCENQ